MKRTLYITIASALMCLPPVFGQVPEGATGQGAGAPSSYPGPFPNAGVVGPQGTGGPPPQADDKKFAKSAALDSLSSLELGKLAEQKAGSSNVRQLAQKTVEEQTKATGRLEQAAREDNVAIPDALNNKQRSKIDKLAKLSGYDFDKEFLKDQIRQNKSQVNSYTNEAQLGLDPNIRDFASKTLPALQAQLRLARNLEKSEAKSR